MKPSEHYQTLIQTERYKTDPNQAKVIAEFDRIYLSLQKKKRVYQCFQKAKPVIGLYLWGGVGIGKTWLMDIFHSCLDQSITLRTHFHRFMRQIHLELKQLQGHANPLALIAKGLAKKIRVLCFDEFFVNDIVDAMLLEGLLQALFNEGICLVTTANLAPDELYKNGLQRERFLPAIDLIKQYTHVSHMESSNDYRLTTLLQAGVYFSPLNEITRIAMRDRFDAYAGTHWKANEMLLIEGRTIPTVRCGSGIVWFNFQDLCNIPRSQIDYLEIARSFHTILLSNVPQIQSHQDNLALYFINLIDILYDNRTKLILSSAVPVSELYIEGRFSFEFQRTKSRLIEMQSIEYLQQPHGG
ncbi:MAG: cell division protein ZapE [Gammaproteobacteria bacterium]